MMKTDRGRKTKTVQPKLPIKLTHVLQLRLSHETVADINYMIATVPQLEGFSRSKFFRAAIRYVLDGLAEEGYHRNRRGVSRPAR